MGGCCDKLLSAAPREPIIITILGTACVGKSTFFKQLKILHLDGFNEEESTHFKKIMYSNILSGIAEIIQAAEQSNVELKKYELEAKLFKDCNGDEDLDLEHVQAAKTLWNAKELVRLRQSPQMKAILNESNIEYFMQHIDEISKPDYQPKNEDIVRCRQRTVGFTQIEFKYEDDIIRVVDVGGHASEQKKWDAMANDVKSILFLASLTHYDVPDSYDPTRTKLEESLQVFDELVHNETWQHSGLILFLNKLDLFEQQIKGRKFSQIFPDFKGDEKDPAECAKHIQSLYEEQLPKGRRVTVHITTAVNTKIMEILIGNVMNSILQSNLNEMGIGM